MSSSWITPGGSPHRLDGLGQDLHHHAHLARPTVGVLVLAQILLGERVDVIVRALLGHLDDPPANLDIAVWVLGVLDRERDARVLLEILVLHAPPRRVEAHVGAVVFHPDRRHLRRAVRADGGDVGECLLREEVAVLLGDRSHRHVLLAALSSSSTLKAWRADFAASVPPIKSPMSSVSAISWSVAPWSRTSSTRCSIQSKQFCETATASAVSSLCFFDSAPSANTSLPISPNARYTFIGDFSIRPLSRFFSVLRSWTCMRVLRL